jgi:hypothetical protein
MIKGSILAHQSLPTAHAGRELCILDVQFHVGGETGLDDSLGTSRMDAILRRGPPPSILTCNLTPGNEHPVREGRAADADPEPGLRTAAAGSRRLDRLGGALHAVRSLRPAGRFARCYIARRRCGSAVGLFSAQSPDGLQQPFFFLLGPSTTPLDRAKMADLFVDADQLVVELLETTELVNLPLRFA